MSPARWAIVAALLIALIVAFQGGEYSTLDFIKLTRQEKDVARQVARLQVVIDSLAKVANAIERDPRMQERVARESFGMIRKGEFLYRLVPRDSLSERAP